MIEKPPAAGSGLRSMFVLIGVMTLAAALLGRIAARGFPVGDEAFYTGVALETLQDGWFPPQLNGAPYIEKPPLPIWLQMISLHMLGPSTFASRLPALLAGLSICALLFRLASRSGRTIPAAAAVLLLCSMPVVNGIHGNHGFASGSGDSLTALLVLGALLAALRYVEAGGRRSLLAATSLSFLSAWTKGAAGPFFLTLALPAVAQFASSTDADVRLVRRRRVGVALPWLCSWLGFSTWLGCLIAADVPRVFQRVLGKGILRRLTQGLDPTHLQGPFYYTELLAGELGPSLLVIAIGAWAALRRDSSRMIQRPEAARVMAAAAAAWLVAIAIPVSKLAWYVIPISPLLAYLFAVGLERLDFRREWARLRMAALAATVLWPLLLTLKTLAVPVAEHPLEAALRRAETVLALRTETADGLRFGRMRELDATEYYLVQTLRYRDRRDFSDDHGSRDACWAQLGFETSVGAQSNRAEEILWQGEARGRPGQLVLTKLCSPLATQ